MTSLTEAYDGAEREVTSLRRLYTGTGLVVLGAVLSVVAVVLATTDLFASLSTTIADPYGTIEAHAGSEIGHYTSVRIAGTLAGVGVPAALVGLFIVLPAGRWVRAAGAISASLCLFGVTLFWYAYPLHWRGVGDDLTLQVSAVYLVGLFIAVWCLFTAVVNFKTRNDPGGMLEMNVTRQNQTILEVPEAESDSADSSGFGGIGFFGATPDGSVETQTNTSETNAGSQSQHASGSADETTDDATILSYEDDERQTPRRSDRSSRSGPRVGAATSDGGSSTQDISSPLDGTSQTDAEIVDAPGTGHSAGDMTDRYCGNCQHFKYVRSSSGIVPYCGLDDEPMDDMDACNEWTPNRR